MDSVLAIASSLPLHRADLLESRDLGSAVYAPLTSSSEENPAEAALNSLQGSDPATQQQKTLQLISHVNAECFISLLQITDPKPDDYQGRAEYKRFYGHLRQTLETQPPSPVARPYDEPPEILR